MYKFFLLVVVLLLGSTNTNLAAASVASSTSMALDNEHIAYILSFNLGDANKDLYFPATTERRTSNSTSSLGYVIKTNEGLRTNDGRTLALLTSDAKIQNGWYHVPKNDTVSFTLVVLHQRNTNSRANTLAITDIPFLISGTKGTSSSRFTTSELKQLTIKATGTAALPTTEDAN